MPAKNLGVSWWRVIYLLVLKLRMLVFGYSSEFCWLAQTCLECSKSVVLLTWGLAGMVRCYIHPLGAATKAQATKGSCWMASGTILYASPRATFLEGTHEISWVSGVCSVPFEHVLKKTLHDEGSEGGSRMAWPWTFDLNDVYWSYLVI